MKLENPPQPEQYDPDAEQPVRELIVLLCAVLAITLTAAAALAWLAGWLAPRLPFAVERDFMSEKFVVDPRYAATSAELQRLADRIGAAMALDPDMKLTVHYSDASSANAYATLGGHIVVHRGLIARVGSENALAAVLAHEIGHIRRRHPASTVGRGIGIGLALSVLSSSVGNRVSEWIVGTTGLGLLMSYSREQEIAADEDALGALAKLYGHLGGAADLFEALRKTHPGSDGGLELMRSHPYVDRRIEHIREFAARNGVPANGTLIPFGLVLPNPADSPPPSLIPEFR